MGEGGIFPLPGANPFQAGGPRTAFHHPSDATRPAYRAYRLPDRWARLFKGVHQYPVLKMEQGRRKLPVGMATGAGKPAWRRLHQATVPVERRDLRAISSGPDSAV